MKQEELKKVLAEVDPLLANAVDSMISFIHTKGKDGCTVGTADRTGKYLF